MIIPIEISARHLHICQKDLDALFGDNYQLHKKYDLKQPGEFASEETVQLVGPRGTQKARVLGPTREQTQIEVSYSDCKFLGIDAPLRLSTDLAGTCGIKLVGSLGELILDSGVIVSQRHIHISPQEAEARNLKEGQIVKVKISGPRAGILDNVIIRIKDNHLLVLHIDTDEANALGINQNNNQGEIIL